MDHLDSWFSVIASDCVLPSAADQELHDIGFVVIPGPVVQARLSELIAAYDAAVLAAHPDDVSNGRSTTRVHDFVNRGPEFDELYVYRPILAACCSIIGQPFKLSTMLARTVNPGSSAQTLHVDFRRDADGWPMVGFIIMVDEFRSDNGSTRFVPGSHLWPQVPGDLMEDPTADFEGPGIDVSVYGPAGSVVIYNGSVLHGQGANDTGQPRRSIQGAFIRRDAQPAVNQAARITPDTLSRISALAKYVLAI
jgi:ectoine hydroxylase-related dioxygenase (phytanoyl-CoA dioxygenase family)